MSGVEKLIQSFRLFNKFYDMSDKDLADRLIKDVWAGMEIGSEEMALVEVAVGRLFRINGYEFGGYRKYQGDCVEVHSLGKYGEVVTELVPVKRRRPE
jgi:hypothetical protein